MNHAKWINYFNHNRLERSEPDWKAPVTVPPHVFRPLLQSIEQFRLGDGGGPASLIARDAENFRGSSDEMRAIVDHWFREEAEHARLLGCAVDRLGGRHIKSHWSFSAFCLCRRAIGVTAELQILLLTELVSTAYYRVLCAHVPDAPIADMCRLILRDEAGHVAFHRERLADTGRSSVGLAGALWQAQFWVFGHAAATMLWLNHGPCLTAIGGSRREYFHEVRRQLRRFILSLDQMSESLMERLHAAASARNVAAQTVLAGARHGLRN